MSEQIGKILQEKLKDEGMPSVKDFASLIDTTPRTLYNVFNGTSELSLDQVIKASDILKFDVIGAYLKTKGKHWEVREPQGTYAAKKNTITLNFSVQAEASAIDEFPAFYKSVAELANQVGYRLI